MNPISSGKSRSNFKVKVTRSKITVPFDSLAQYESSITSGKKVIAKVKVFVHASNADADTDAVTRAMTLAPQTFVPARLK